MALKTKYFKVVGLKDILEAGSAGAPLEVRRKRLKEARELLDTLDLPVYDVVGNHEMKDRADGGIANDDSLIDASWYSWNHKGVHFISLNTCEGYRKLPVEEFMPRSLFGGSFKISEEQVSWLKDDLREYRSVPTLVFCHVPLDGRSGLSYDSVQNDHEVRNALQNASVVAVVQAHSHHPNAPDWSGYIWRESGLPYLFLPSLGSRLGGSYSTLNFSEDGLSIRTRFLGHEKIGSVREWSVPGSFKDFSLLFLADAHWGSGGRLGLVGNQVLRNVFTNLAELETSDFDFAVNCGDLIDGH